MNLVVFSLLGTLRVAFILVEYACFYFAQRRSRSGLAFALKLCCMSPIKRTGRQSGKSVVLSGAFCHRDLVFWGRVTRHDSLSKTILQGTLEGGRRRGRQRKCWMDNIKDWISLPMPEPQEKTGRGSLLNRPSCPFDESIGQGTELKSTQLN